MRVLIAGCGDVGGVLATLLLQDGHVVYGLRRNVANLPEGVIPIQADLTRPNTLTELPRNIDRLVFMPTPAHRNEAGYEAIFIQGWNNLWAGMQDSPERTLVVSSTAVYGESGGAVVNENSDPGPTGFNGKALLRMEQLAATCTAGLVVVRMSGIYGPGRERLIDLAASEGLEIQQTPPYFTNRIHRDDAAAVLKHLMLIEEPFALYIATDDLPAPRYEVFEWLAKVQGVKAPKAIAVEHASKGKRICNQRLKDSGFNLSFPDYRSGYTAILDVREKK